MFVSLLVSAWETNDNWRFGIAGYYLKQLSRDKQDGIELPNFKERVFAIGPGLRYHILGVTVRANAYFEARRRTGRKVIS